MTWEPRPVPDVTPETERFWAAATDGRFLLRECNECGLIYYYPRALCPDCLSDDVDWIDAAGDGTVYAYSVSESIDGWPEDELPVLVAYVELDEGPRLVTNLVDCNPEDVEINAHVEVKFEDTRQDYIAVPVFKLI